MAVITKQHYIFFRAEGWYPLLLRDDADARRNAECNPGTTRVENVAGTIIWEEKKSEH